MRNPETLIVSRHQVFLRFIDVPSIDKAEIKKMAGFQAIKEIPCVKEDMVIGYRNLGSYRNDFSSLMLAVANKDMIKEMIARKEIHNVKLKGVELYTELLYLFMLKKGAINHEEARLIMHIGQEYTEIMIVDKIRPIFSREFKNKGQFLEETRRSVSFYERNRNNPKIEKITILHDSNIDIEDARQTIERCFELKPDFCEYDDDLTKSGLAAEIDLLPIEISNIKKKVQKKQEDILTYSLVGLVIFLFFAFCSFRVHKMERFLQLLSSRIDEIEPHAENLAEYIRKTEIVKEGIKEGSLIAEVLRDSHNLVPSDVRLSGISYDGIESVFYKGDAKDMSGILDFIKRLEGSRYFGSTQIKYATRKELRGEEFTDFNIQCTINSSPIL